MSARDQLTLREQLALEGALDVAFARLAARRSTVSAARVRAAVRWGVAGRAAPRRMPVAIAARVAGYLFAASFAALLVAGPARAPADEPRRPSVIEAYFRAQPPTDEAAYLRWLRLAARDDLAARAAEPAPIIPVDER